MPIKKGTHLKTHCLRGHLRCPENITKCGACLRCKYDYTNQKQKRLRATDPAYADAERKRKREYDLVHPEAKRAAWLKTKYGITPEEFEAKKQEQCNKCAICGREFGKEHRNRPNTDHRHDGTKNHRGLLCLDCNTGIGKFQENIEFLQQAIAYLSEWTQKGVNVRSKSVGA